MVPPTIASVMPNSGPEAGGTAITIVGTGFAAGQTTATIGGVSLLNVTIVYATTLTATTSPGMDDVVVTARLASASVSRLASSSTGSYPVSHYLVMPVPGGRMRLMSTLTCEVPGVTNGTAHTFTVRALTGAGWSAASVPSNVVTPAPLCGRRSQSRGHATVTGLP